MHGEGSDPPDLKYCSSLYLQTFLPYLAGRSWEKKVKKKSTLLGMFRIDRGMLDSACIRQQV